MNTETLLAMLKTMLPPPDRRVRLKFNMLHTRYLFGPLSEIEGKELRVLDENEDGDCLCLIDDEKGQRLVDVDHRDIKP